MVQVQLKLQQSWFKLKYIWNNPGSGLSIVGEILVQIQV